MKYTEEQLLEIIDTVYEAVDKSKVGPIFLDGPEVPVDRRRATNIGMTVFERVLTCILYHIPPKEDWKE